MLNAHEANAAVDALTYPRGISDRDERVAAHAAYRAATSMITAEFRAWLANQYASSLPVSVQSKIWEKSWEDGHSAGYSEVESHYMDNADFAEFAFNAGKATSVRGGGDLPKMGRKR